MPNNNKKKKTSLTDSVLIDCKQIYVLAKVISYVNAYYGALFMCINIRICSLSLK